MLASMKLVHFLKILPERLFRKLVSAFRYLRLTVKRVPKATYDTEFVPITFWQIFQLEGTTVEASKYSVEYHNITVIKFFFI